MSTWFEHDFVGKKPVDIQKIDGVGCESKNWDWTKWENLGNWKRNESCSHSDGENHSHRLRLQTQITLPKSIKNRSF